MELKPSKIEKLPDRKSSLEKVDLKPVPTAVTEKITEKKIIEKTKYFEEEDTALLEVSKTEELKKMKKDKVEEKPEEKPKLWTEEKVTLKKTKPVKKKLKRKQ